MSEGVMLKKLARDHKTLGLKRTDLVDGLEKPIGAARALLKMQEAAIRLLI